MNNFGVLEVDPNDLLLKLEQQLQQSGTPPGSNLPGAGLGDRAFLSLFPDKLHLENPVATEFVTIRPVNFPVWQGVVTGAGRDYTGFDASLVLTCFIQMSADPEMKNTNAISEMTRSVTTLVFKVLSAVQFWTPQDADGNDMLREYARIPDGGFQFTPVDGSGGPWVKVALAYQMKFTAKLPALG